MEVVSAVAESGRVCVPDLKRAGIFTPIVYNRENLETWAGSYRLLKEVLRRRAHPMIQHGLNALGISDSEQPQLGEISQKLEDLCGWRLIEVDGWIPNDSYFQLASERVLPVSPQIRPKMDLHSYRWVDVIHGIVHLPHVMDPSISEFWQKMGAVGAKALQTNDKALFTQVERAMWHTGERGVISCGGVRWAWGALLASYDEECDWVMGGKVDVEPYSTERATSLPLAWEGRNDYAITEFQNTYLEIERFSDLLNGLDAWVSRSVNLH